MQRVQYMLVLLSATCIALTACQPAGGSVEPSALRVNLVGTRWELISLNRHVLQQVDGWR